MPTICDREVSESAIKHARDMAAFYRSRGYQPLPSRPDEKRPMVGFKEFWESPTPDDLFEKHPTSNIQLICGRRWKLLVIDLDGEEAQDRWPTLGQSPKTWVTHSGGDGQHWWFRLPDNYSTKLPTGFLWKGVKDKHSGIERICDKGLIVVPPSIHPGNGRQYKFLKWHAPQNIPMPAMCPEWLLKYPIKNPVKPPAPILRTPSVPSQSWDGVTMYDANTVLDAIHDKVSLAKSWGLRVADCSRDGEWVPCHAIDREDIKPSAAIHSPTGVYTDRGSGNRLSFLALSVALGQFLSRKDAIQFLGERYVHHAATPLPKATSR